MLAFPGAEAPSGIHGACVPRFPRTSYSGGAAPDSHRLPLMTHPPRLNYHKKTTQRRPESQATPTVRILHAEWAQASLINPYFSIFL